MYSGVAARAAEFRKHSENDTKCAQLSWKCIPLGIESYGAWDPEALKAFSQVATRLAIRGNTYINQRRWLISMASSVIH